MKWLALLLVCLSASVTAIELTASGLAECAYYAGKESCKKGAEKSTLDSLANQLYTKIESQTFSQADNQGQNLFQWSAKTQTNLELLGTKVTCTFHPPENSYHCEASMATSTAAPMYSALLQQLSRRLNDGERALTANPGSVNLAELEQLTNDYQAFEKALTVYQLLLPNQKLPSVSLSYQQLRHQLDIRQSRPQSLQELAQTVLSKSTRRGLIISAPLAVGSHEVTPFANALYQTLQANLPANVAADSSQHSHYQLSGAYQVNANHMDISFCLMDPNGKIEWTGVWQLAPKLYENWRTEPETLDFEQLIKQGVLVADDFRVELQTNKGSHNLTFIEGETAKLMLKLNRSGYIYILGHTRNSAESKSYLLPLRDEPAPYAFELYVPPENANKWIDISDGGFAIIPPFGQETLQAFASDTSFIKSGRLPNTVEEGDYFLVDRNAQAAITKTRGFAKIKTVKAATAEASLDIATFARITTP